MRLSAGLALKRSILTHQQSGHVIAGVPVLDQRQGGYAQRLLDEPHRGLIVKPSHACLAVALAVVRSGAACVHCRCRGGPVAVHVHGAQRPKK